MSSELKLMAAYEKACNDYAEELCRRWDIGDGYWAGGVGETYCIPDTGVLSMSDLVFCVDEGVSSDEYYEWLDYCDFADEFGQNHINLRSWHMGYHGLPSSSQMRLRKMKQAFEDAIKECRAVY